MKHSFIDQYSDLNSFIHRLDPRTKLLACPAFILLVVLTPAGNWKLFIFYLCVIAILILVSRLPLLYVLKRSLIIFPFVLMVAVFIPFFKQGQAVWSYAIGVWHISVTYEGLLVLANVLIKSWLSMLSLILLSSSTRMADLLEGMKQLGTPKIFILIISFMYRYLFILADQVIRMSQARDSRNFGGSRSHQFRTLGNMIGTLFIRSYERGERVYAAMLARGYNGEMPVMKKLNFKSPDAYFSLVMAVLLICPAILWWQP
jgi:cobalt/nickel transport system permease protein